MAKPLVVSLSHELGQEEARRRLTAGLDYLRTQHAKLITVNRSEWDGNRLSFEISTLGQSASGFVDVEPERATLTITLPFLLAMLADKAQALIKKEGQLLLEKK